MALSLGKTLATAKQVLRGVNNNFEITIVSLNCLSSAGTVKYKVLKTSLSNVSIEFLSSLLVFIHRVWNLALLPVVQFAVVLFQINYIQKARIPEKLCF